LTEWFQGTETSKLTENHKAAANHLVDFDPPIYNIPEGEQSSLEYFFSEFFTS